MTEESKGPTIEATPNGPYVIRNPPAIRNSKGAAVEAKAVTALCRCGRSQNKPFCDGTHAKAGFSSAREADGSANRKDDYQGKSVTIHDNRGICAHAGVCTDQLKSVFRLGQEPWIDPNGAEQEAIANVVKECPSGALSYTVSEVEHAEFEREPGITITKNGPYAVVGRIALRDPTTGQEPSVAEHYALCRCGGSKNKPFCDGTHWKGFVDEKN